MQTDQQLAPPARPVQHLAVINASTLVSDRQVELMVEAYRGQPSDDFKAAWGVAPPGMAVYTPDHRQRIDEEALIVLVDAGHDPDAFAWHAVLGRNRYGYVDVGGCLAGGEPVERAFGHELWELTVDPDVDRSVLGPDGWLWSLEVSDAVQRYSRPMGMRDPVYGVGVVPIADYVTPAWFTPGSAGPWSEQGSAPGPFQLAPGGYITREKGGALASLGAGPLKSWGRAQRRLDKLRAAARAM